MSALSTRVSVPDEVCFRDFGGEAVILELGTGLYYGLDEVGTRMWLRLQEHGEIEAACRALLEDYRVSERELRQDLLDFVDRLASRKLLEVHR